MSLIEEALRRIQDPVIAKIRDVHAPSKTSEPSQSQTAAVHSWPTSSLPPASTPPPLLSKTHRALLIVTGTAVGLVIALLLVGTLWLGRARSVGRSAISKNDAVPLNPPAAALPTQDVAVPSQTTHAAQASQAAQRTPEDKLVLTGVVEGLGDPYAVINGMILAVGDQIEGATVLEVGSGVVKLRRADGETLTLRVPR